jgi:hypothetical protein
LSRARAKCPEVGQGAGGQDLDRKSRDRLQACEDHYQTVQLAKQELQREAPDLRGELVIAELRYQEALKSLVHNSSRVMLLIEAHDAALRKYAELHRAMEFLSSRGLLPLVTFGVRAT